MQSQLGRAPVGAGAAISNRVSVSTDWTRASADIAPGTDFDTFRWSRMPTAHADQRLAVTTAAIGADRVPTVADLARVLRSHGVARSADELPEALDDEANGFSVCMHRPELHSQTTASLIAELSASTPPRVWVALGNPCCSVYVPGFPPAVPAELAAASEWERFARLRNRVEATPGDLAGVRATLGAVEAELWAAADTAHASGLQADLDAYIGTAYRPVADALHRLGV